MSPQKSLVVGGVFNFLFAMFHFALPWVFAWSEDLAPLSRPNQAFVYTSHWVVILFLLLFAYVSIALQTDLLGTRLGRAVLIMIASVWLIRSATEVLVFRIGEEGAIWRLALFLTIAALYVYPALAKRR